MNCPTLEQLPAPRTPDTGWPWTEETSSLPAMMPDGSPWPKVSIITPSYNQGEFIEETIRSVLLQGYPNLEYIIVDGGSTDDSVEIIRRYEPWLAYWVSEEDRGQSHAINKGLKRATGVIVAWLNSDDYYWPRAIATAVEALHQDPNAGFVYSDGDILDVPTQTFRRFQLKDRTVAELLRDGNCVTQPTAFIPTSTLKRVGLIREDLHMILDYELWIRIKRVFPVIHLAGTSLAVSREYPAAKSVDTGYRRCPEFLRIFNEIYSNGEVEPCISGVRRMAYGRVFLHCALGDVGRGRAFPHSLIWYAKALLHRPRWALANPLVPLWLLREATRQVMARALARFRKAVRSEGGRLA